MKQEGRAAKYETVSIVLIVFSLKYRTNYQEEQVVYNMKESDFRSERLGMSGRRNPAIPG